MAENRRRRPAPARPRAAASDHGSGPSMVPIGSVTADEVVEPADRVVDLTIVGPVDSSPPRKRGSSAPVRREVDPTEPAGDEGDPSSVRDGDGAPIGPRITPRTRLVLITVAASLAFVVAAAAIAAAVTASGSEVYAATADVRYRAVDNPAFGAGDRALEAQTQAVLSRSVIVPAAAELAVGPEDLRSRLSAALLTDSDVLRIEARGDTVEEAERTLSVVVATYIERVEAESPDEGQAYLESELTALEERISGVEVLLQDPDRDPASSATLQLQTDYAALLDQRTFLAEMLADLAVQELDAPRVDMLAEPHAPADPVEPRPARAALVAAVTAGLVALLGAYFILRRPHLQ